MNAIIFGAPGSGKGTYSSRLQATLGLEVIAMGDIFREMQKKDDIIGRIIKDYVGAGLLVPDIIVLEVLKEHIKKAPKGKGFILDGFPRNLVQADALEKITKIDVVLDLIVPDWIIIERLSSRRICKDCGTVYNIRFLKPKVEGICDKCGGQLYLRNDDNPEVIKKRFELYQKETSPLIQYYKQKQVPFIAHTADKLVIPPDEIVNSFVKEIKKLNFA